MVALPGSVVRHSRGRFADITVLDYVGRRWLYSGKVLQAIAFLEPAAASVSADLPAGPGPVQGCTYTLPWLAAGLGNSAGRGLMLGLGGGEGAIALLYHFPDLRLDVVEIDPTIIDVARAVYPLLQHYEHGKRLQIRTGDANRMLAEQPVYDFLICDIDPARGEIYPDLLNPKFISSLLSVTAKLWINVIDRPGGRAEITISRALQEAGHPVVRIFSCQPNSRNQILTTQPVDERTLQSFEPYAGIDGGGPELARRRFARLVSGH